MARNDSILYTGITSVSSEPQTPRQAQAESKVQAKQKLKPAADLVIELINKERDNIVDIRSLVVTRESTEEGLAVELSARKMYLGYLNSLEAKVKNIMAEKKPKKPVVTEGFDEQ